MDGATVREKRHGRPRSGPDAAVRTVFAGARHGLVLPVVVGSILSVAAIVVT
jgi:hypothetical protein